MNNQKKKKNGKVLDRGVRMFWGIADWIWNHLLILVFSLLTLSPLCWMLCCLWIITGLSSTAYMIFVFETLPSGKVWFSAWCYECLIIDSDLNWKRFFRCATGLNEWGTLFLLFQILSRISRIVLSGQLSTCWLTVWDSSDTDRRGTDWMGTRWTGTGCWIGTGFWTVVSLDPVFCGCCWWFVSPSWLLLVHFSCFFRLVELIKQRLEGFLRTTTNVPVSTWAELDLQLSVCKPQSLGCCSAGKWFLVAGARRWP